MRLVVALVCAADARRDRDGRIAAQAGRLSTRQLAERHGLSKRQIRRIMAAARGEEERPCTAS